MPQEPPERLSGVQMAGPTPGVPESVGLGQGVRICLLHTLRGDCPVTLCWFQVCGGMIDLTAG